MNGEHDLSFHAMGSEMRLLIGSPLVASAPPAVEAAVLERAYIEDFSARLSRFRHDSELCALNADTRERVPASPLLRAAVTAAVWAAQRSEGLIDPTLVGALERLGYERSRDGERPAPLTEALALVGPRMPAAPDPAGRWREIAIDEAAGVIARPPGVRIDTGGTGKGLCADAVAHRLRRYSRFVVDCGGDLTIGGVAAQLDPYDVEIEHPLSGETIRTIRVGAGGVATSGLNVNVWTDALGRPRHHLIDPATGDPAWTGVVGATALAPSALEAETLAKMALLLGPAGARRVLERHGGLIVLDDGDVEEIGPLDAPVGVLVHRGLAA